MFCIVILDILRLIGEIWPVEGVTSLTFNTHMFGVANLYLGFINIP